MTQIQIIITVIGLDPCEILEQLSKEIFIRPSLISWEFLQVNEQIRDVVLTSWLNVLIDEIFL